MLRRLAPLAVLVATALAGCGDDASETPDADPTSSATSSASGSAAGSPGSPTADAVIAEVTAVAPALESAYRSGPYPETVDDVVASLAPSGVTLTDGIEVGGYVYDPEAVEFTLCLQDATGAWASYDTAPMGVRDSGTTGGCPQG